MVFMDNDIFVFKSLARIFEHEDFDYGCTISDSKAMPVCAAARHCASTPSPKPHAEASQRCVKCPVHFLSVS